MTQQDMPRTVELRLTVPPGKKEDFASYLLGLGLSGFVEGALDCDIPFEYGPEHLHHDYYVDHDQGMSPLVFYATSRSELEAVLSRIAAHLHESGLEAHELQVGWDEISETSWKDSWKESFRPLLLSGCLAVLPPWEDPAQHPAQVHVIIDPGMAFGTGQHETTQLCLRIFLERSKRAYGDVLDVGTGSGILAIAARKFGCNKVTGCDIDPDSIRIAKENALANGHPELKWSTAPASAFQDAGYDLVFANITARPLLSLLPALAQKARPKAHFIASGVLLSEQDEFAAALAGAGFEVLDTLQHNDWVGFWARRKG